MSRKLSGFRNIYKKIGQGRMLPRSIDRGFFNEYDITFEVLFFKVDLLFKVFL